MAVIAPPHSGLFDARSVIVIVCSTLALYNAIELLLLVFTTFKRWRGLYFWSLLVASFGVIPYYIGFLIVFFQLTHDYVGFIIDTYGWITMVTGQSVVLYSRLHLVLHHGKILRLVLWMIIVNAVVFHISTTVVLFGSSLGHHQQGFNGAWTVIEKLQMTAFCVQEFIISGLYLYETVRLLKLVSMGTSLRRTMWQLVIVNVIIIALDIALLVVEYRDLRTYEQAFKGVVYSIKLKCEFAILGKLVNIVRSGGGNTQTMTNTLGDATDYVDFTTTRSPSDATVRTEVASPPHRKGSSSRMFWMKDVDHGSAEHVERAAPPPQPQPPSPANTKSESQSADLEANRTADPPRGIDEMMQATNDTRRPSGRRATDSDTLYAEMMREISR